MGLAMNIFLENICGNFSTVPDLEKKNTLVPDVVKSLIIINFQFETNVEEQT